MKKKDLTIEHLLVTRNRQVYWHVGDKLGTKNNVIGCTSSTNKKLDEIWDENLLTYRDDRCPCYEEPRYLDVIYIYKIIDMEQWFEIFHENDYIDFEEHLQDDYTYKPFVKQIYERIDGELE